MKTENKSKKLIGAGVLTAVTASLCCITPVLAIFAGASGVASTFSWIEPFRPYLIGITILVLTYAWYQKLRPVSVGAKGQEIDCECDEDGKPSFWQSKLFLGIVTVFAVIMLAFPYYSYVFYPVKKSNVVQNIQSNINESVYKVEGLTCESCDQHVEHEVSNLPGYLTAVADFKTGLVKVKYDNTKSSEQDVIDAINKTGYKIVDTISKVKKEKTFSELILTVNGLTCESCDQHVEHEVSLLPGYMAAVSDYKTGIVKVKYDNSKSSKQDIVDAVNKTGYKVVDTISPVKEEKTFSELILSVNGLTCEGCDRNLERQVASLPGYIDAISDYKTGVVKIEYDKTKSSKEDVVAAVNKTGFKVIDSLK
jgi:mercuric ion transport protein